MSPVDLTRIPRIDVRALRRPGGDAAAVAREIGRACRDVGFFYAVGHGVDPALERRLESAARRFFAWPDARKAEVGMARGGRAWRGWFPVGGELTSGAPDWKEGLYFGAELPAEDPRVRAGLPMHGPNLFPALPGFRDAVLAWIDAMTALGHALARGLALALSLPPDQFARELTRDPLVLFRIFHYPPPPADAPVWGVGEHTDYGLLTILKQDDAGGLEVHARDGWISAPPDPDAFVCNLGDMLERMTGGRFRSTPHRVRNRSGRSRLSYPFFFDPGWDAVVQPLPGCETSVPGGRPRWDGADLSAGAGLRYGDYVLSKVSKVFPALRDEVL